MPPKKFTIESLWTTGTRAWGFILGVGSLISAIVGLTMWWVGKFNEKADMAALRTYIELTDRRIEAIHIRMAEQDKENIQRDGSMKHLMASLEDLKTTVRLGFGDFRVALDKFNERDERRTDSLIRVIQNGGLLMPLPPDRIGGGREKDISNGLPPSPPAQPSPVNGP